MDWLYTWSGKSFGYKDGDNLWTHDGKHVGKFYGNEIYGESGNYLGEINDGKLITKKNKTSRRSSFNPYMSRVGYVNRVNQVGRVMYSGYEDFPAADTF
ncbi:4-fold beta flower protein [Lysinibacillus xylanilyticus]|uniref:4-fold beta flower protein n=1 Tax=Lysinibacillus xylanilyticus TaxID=582475 RepID=UPI003D059033